MREAEGEEGWEDMDVIVHQLEEGRSFPACFEFLSENRGKAGVLSCLSDYWTPSRVMEGLRGNQKSL